MKPHLPLPGRGRKKDSNKKNGERRRIDIQRTGLAVATVAVLSVLLCIHLLPDKVTLVPGEIAPEDIRATRSVRYTDTYEFKRQQMEAAASVNKIYDRIPYALDVSLRELNGIFDVIDASRGYQSDTPDEEKATRARSEIKKQVGIEAPYQALLVLMAAPHIKVMKVRDVTTKLVRDAMTGDIRDDVPEISKVQTHLTSAAEDSFGNTAYAAAAAELGRTVIHPNMVFNFEKTAAERARAIAAVKPIRRNVRTGDLVISKGEPVTREHVELFTALGLRQRLIDYRTIVSLTALVAFLVVLVIIYLARYQPAIYKTTRLLVMLSLVVLVSTFGLKLGGGMLGIKSGIQLAYIGMMFTTLAGMVLAALLNPQVAVLIVAMLSIVSGLVTNYELRYTAATLVSGLVAIYAVANIRGRADLMRALGAIAITNVAMVWIMGGIFGDSWLELLSGSGWVVILVAVPATWLFWSVTWLLERPFRVTTHISLLELADTNKPILRRLVVEAPGTYIHSMAVGHLAEAASEAIGADSLFARVASYYHDIGKIRRPQFFVENQRMEENVHDRLTPTLSALIITSHIKDGLEVAREFKLPPSIQDVILQHHGTSLVQYFYCQASEQVGSTPVLEQQFRYEGPKPQSKEAAIIMLADSVEAASRSLTKSTPPALEALVDKIVTEKMQDGQLDESELTFHEIGIIKASFVHSLTSTLHARIEYPDGVTVENGKTSSNGNTDQKFTADDGGPEEVDEDREEAAANTEVP